MFYFIPEDCERLIYKNYYCNHVIPELVFKIKEINTKNHFNENVITELKDSAVYTKAEKIINSIIDKKNIERTIDNFIRIDEMFYTLVDLHNQGIFDLFQI